MIILPAIDVRHGNCVRLFQGKADQETVYSLDPIDMARIWKSKGAKMIHIVDLDGAFEGKPVNLPLISAIRKTIQIPIEVGGGFRDLASIREAFHQGIDRVILGTAALRNPDLVAQAVQEFGAQVTVSIDVSGQYATAAGWTEVSMIPFNKLADDMRALGIQDLLFTDTSRDGTLQGPNLTVIEQFLQAARMPVTISGGITTVEDITSLKPFESIGLKAVVIGKALYDEKIQLEDAIEAAGIRA